MIPDDIVFENLQGFGDLCPLFSDAKREVFYCGEDLLLSSGKIASVRTETEESLYLIITGLKIKRLQEFNFQEAVGEGVFLQNLEDLIENDMIDPDKILSSEESLDAVEIAVKNSFIELWNKNCKNQFSWEKNPFVVVYEFVILPSELHYLTTQ